MIGEKKVRSVLVMTREWLASLLGTRGLCRNPRGVMRVDHTDYQLFSFADFIQQSYSSILLIRRNRLGSHSRTRGKTCI